MVDVGNIVSDAWNGLVNYFLGYPQNDLDVVVQQCSWALSINPRYGMAYSTRGIANFELGKTDQALDDLANARDIEGSANTYNNLGDVYRKLGRFEEAIHHLSIAIELEPDSPIGYINRAVAYNQSGNFFAAYSDLTKAQKLHSMDPGSMGLEDPLIHFQLGDTYLGMEAIDLALEHYEIAKRILEQRGLTALREWG